MEGKRLLVVDDEPDIAELVCAMAEQAGYECRATTLVADFLHALDDFMPTVVVIDIVMYSVDGIELTRYLADMKYKVHVVLISGYNPKFMEEAETLGKARGLASINKLKKPFRKEEMLGVLRSLS